MYPLLLFTVGGNSVFVDIWAYVALGWFKNVVDGSFEVYCQEQLSSAKKT